MTAEYAAPSGTGSPQWKQGIVWLIDYRAANDGGIGGLAALIVIYLSRANLMYVNFGRESSCDNATRCASMRGAAFASAGRAPISNDNKTLET